MKQKILNFLHRSYLAIIICMIYIPLIVVILLSFTNGSAKDNLNLGFDWNAGQNWLNLFKNNEFINALTNTTIIVVIVVPCSTIIATITCFGIWHAKSFYKNTIIGISKINIVIPDVISGIGLALLFAMTIIPMQINLGFATIILSHISFCTPYAIILIYPRMLKMNKNLILASLDLGYSSIHTFFKVTIPFLMPSIISAAALVFGMSFDDFIITRLVGGKIDTISTQIYSMAKGIKMWAVTFGAIVVVVSIGLAILIAFKNTIFKRRSQVNKLEKQNE